jgi:hypothetical protein
MPSGNCSMDGQCFAVSNMERCPSGLRSTPGKCVYGLNPYRGFESLSLRHIDASKRSVSMVAPLAPRDDRLKTPPGPEGSNGIN